MKKIVKLGIIFIIAVIGAGIYKYLENPKDQSKEIKEERKSNDRLTMMLETESGIYEETTTSNWPTNGYIFNATLSKCENGGTLSWDDENKKVIMESNTSDKCYAYFDVKTFSFNVESVGYGSTEISLYINDVPINVGESIKYKIGDKLRYKIASVYNCDLYIYNQNDDELFSETHQRCFEDTYILTGNETRIVVATVGHPETSQTCEL